MTSVIVAATPVAGHTYPLLQLAARLRSAGHAVVFVGGRRFVPAAADLGLRAVPLTGRADYDDRRLAEQFPDIAAAPPGLERINVESMRVFGDPIPDQHATLQALLREDPDSVLVTDILFAGAFPAACGVGVRPRRWVSVGIAPVYARSVDTTPFGPAPGADDAERAAANLAGFEAFSGALAPTFEHVSRIVGGLGGRLGTPDWVSTLYDLPDVTAELSVPEFEFPRRDLPGSLRYVGIVPPRTSAWQPPGWWADLNDGRPVVLVTQGTLANRDLTEVVVPTVEALAREDCLVIAALGRPTADLGSEVPMNARVVEYLPFDRLLPHVDVFVTNGGFGATQQALAAGVPAVVAGATEDKPATAARVAYHRVGLDLATQRPAPEQLRNAVRTVLGDRGYRERTATLAAAYARYDAGTLVADLLTSPLDTEGADRS